MITNPPKLINIPITNPTPIITIKTLIIKIGLLDTPGMESFDLIFKRKMKNSLMSTSRP
jgi:hypothetical protein